MGSQVNHLTYLLFQGHSYVVTLKIQWSPITFMSFISVSNKETTVLVRLNRHKLY